MKIKIISLLLVISLLLCSCNNTLKSPTDSETEDNITYEQTNTDGINGVYIITEKGPVAIAYTKDGRLSLVGDVYYYNLKNVLENDETVKQKTFTFFDYEGKNTGGKTYQDFQNSKENPYKTLALSGNWRLCPKMRHIKYGEKDKLIEEYKSYFLNTFPEKINEQNLKITDVWETDLNCDGTNEAIVKASDDNYTAIVLLSEVIGNSVLFSNFEKTQNFDADAFFADLDGNGIPSVLILSGDSVKTLCVYKEKSSTVSYCVYLPIV